MSWRPRLAIGNATQSKAHQALAAHGRVHIPDFLTDNTARDLLEALADAPWRLALNQGATTYQLGPEDVQALSLDKRRALLGAIHANAAAESFQFLYDTCRISDDYESGARRSGRLAELFAWLNDADTLQCFRRITGDERIAYVDAQATRYCPGHFLTEHTDEAETQNRLYAYVLNLTPDWRAEWGGLLMFHAGDGHVAEAYTPRWNALNLLRVPTPHSVSQVATFAPADRLAITGWLRSARS